MTDARGEQTIEQSEPERGAAVGRNSNSLYVLPHDETELAQVLAPLMERVVVTEVAETQLLVLVPDAEAALAAARTSVGGAVALVPVTSAVRALRLLRARPALAVAIMPADALELIRGSALKLGGVKTVVFAYADAILESGAADELESLLAEVPKDAARVVITSAVTPAVTELVERYARRARKIGGEEVEAKDGTEIHYVTTTTAGKPAALRRLLDELDPDAAAVYARGAASATEVRGQLRALGYASDSPHVVVTDGEPVERATVLILFDMPPSRDTLRAMLGNGMTVVALAQPRQISAFRALAGSSTTTPHVLAGPAAKARSREDQLRAELRSMLAHGAPTRELLALEPLLDEYDGIELAAAALRMLEIHRARERERAPKPSGEPAASHAPARSATPTLRLFINAGGRDNVTTRDLVGAIANESGISADKIGKVELRDNHSIVEIAADVAEMVVQKLSGTAIRGRKVVARVDKERPDRESRGGPSREGRGGPPRDGRSGPPRSGPRGEGRDAPRRDGPPRGRAPRRDDARPPRAPRNRAD